MRQREIEIMGRVLANPIRRYILQYLENPKNNPKNYTGIKNQMSDHLNRKITDGSFSWYLKDLLALGLIRKNGREYQITDLGEKITIKIQQIMD